MVRGLALHGIVEPQPSMRNALGHAQRSVQTEQFIALLLAPATPLIAGSGCVISTNERRPPPGRCSRSTALSREVNITTSPTLVVRGPGSYGYGNRFGLV